MAADGATPAYLLASDIHTSLNNPSQEKGFLESSFDLVTKGIPATLIAAGNEIANIPATVGNMVSSGNPYKITKAREAIASFDSDLARYYDDHQLGIDAAGFIVGSFVPGMAGTKVLRAGQYAVRGAVESGTMGSLTSSAIGLVAPSRQKHIAEAISQIGKNSSTFALTESNLMRAFIAGAGQQALEGAAFTVAVNATMNQSPIMNDRDISDLTFDVLVGAGLGGAVGGLIDGIQAAYKVKGAFAAAEKEMLPWTIKGLGGVPAESLSTSDKILKKVQQLEAIPEVPKSGDMMNRIAATAEKTRATLKTEIRTLAGDLAGGDQDVAQLLSKNIELNGFQDNLANLLESAHVSRITVKSAIEKAEAKRISEIAKAAKKADELVDFNAPGIQSNLKISYVNTRTMQVMDEPPKVLNLGDFGRPVVKGSTVTAGGRVYKQDKIADIVTMKPLEVEARYKWAEVSTKLDPEKTTVIGVNDIPMMQKALREGNPNVVIGDIAFAGNLPALDEFVRVKQATVAVDLIKAGIKNNDEVAKMVNVAPEALFGAVDNKELWNHRDFLRNTLTKTMGADPNDLPAYLKITTNPSNALDTDGFKLEGMAIIAEKERLYKQRADLIAAQVLKEELPDAAGLKFKPVGVTTGSGAFTSENGNYGTASAFWAYVGQRVQSLIKREKEITTDVFNPTLQKLAVNTNDAIEWSVLNEKLRNLPGKYYLTADGTALRYGKEITEDAFDSVDDFAKAIAKQEQELVENTANGIPDVIPIQSPLVQKLVADHIARNATRRTALQQIHVNNGYPDRFDADVFYPIPRNPRDTPHFAFVVDESVNSTGHSKMIYAKDAETLEVMRNDILSDTSLRERGIRVLTKSESEEYYKSIGKFEFERTLSENYINTALARKGKSASFLPLTDPQRIVQDFIEWHTARDASLVRSTVEHKYAQDFATLRQYASGSLEAAKSKFGYVSPLAYAENAVDNPATNLIKLALDISKVDEYPLWTPINKFLDEGYSNLVAKIGKVFGSAASSKHLDEVNAALHNAGYNDRIVDSALYEAMNGKIERGKLTALVNRANAILATFALRSDPFNALNNAVGSSVLLGSEAKAVIRAIENGNAEAVGELAKLAKIKVPGAEGLTLSPQKLIADRITKFHTDKEGREWFKKHGFISSITDLYDSTLDNIATAFRSGDETAMEKAFASAKKMGDSAERFTGNALAEEFNRYVAAGVMKDITDVAVKHGLMDERTALSYINTFVNRTQGNYIASQRPVIFQGPLGQAMGLFQTYQFNLLQQVFRHVGESGGKDALVMAGLQFGVYGLNGLPAFNAINTYIVGDAPGNTSNKTLYDAVLSGAGKEAGEWLLYGGLSNGLSIFHPDLKTNIYSRGDINPRHITLIPVNPVDTPIYQATSRLMKNMHDSFKQVSMGADVWGTFLRGIEQNGVSRPLAGMAQVLEGMGRPDLKVISTNQQGNMLMAHDLYSLTSLMRVAGAKPLDEAMVNDQMFRIDVWRKSDSAKRRQLAEGIRTSIINGQVPGPEQIEEFAYSYARAGGKQSEFAAFMAAQYRNTSVSQAEQLRRNLSSPYSQSLQLLMNGGEE
jgi:hypothetical protein